MLISKFNTESVREDIETYEKKHNMVFPEQYRMFLLKYNGGRTPKTKFKFGRISSDLTGFYGFDKSNPTLHFERFENMGLINDYLEDELLPIGANVFGDYILIGIGTNNNGIIYFYYHDREKKYHELTEDLKTFFNKCKSEKIGHIRTIEERKESLIQNGIGHTITPERLAGWQAEIDRYANIVQEELIIE